jgi:ubiquinone/menaquinone biosynthesis C-methylase UbiE
MSRHPHADVGHGRGYLPAMGRDWLLPLYDPFTRLVGAPAAHRLLIEQADLRPGHRVLEIGCGTGNLLLMTKRRHPEVAATGLDPDPRGLARAGRKARRARLPVRLDRGFASELPYPDGAFDRVFSALMFHHLPVGDRPAALREARRVLAPGGSLHLLDFSRPDGSEGHLARLLHRNAHAHAVTDDLAGLMRAAGFTEVTATGERSTRVGRYATFRAVH